MKLEESIDFVAGQSEVFVADLHSAMEQLKSDDLAVCVFDTRDEVGGRLLRRTGAPDRPRKGMTRAIMPRREWCSVITGFDMAVAQRIAERPPVQGGFWLIIVGNDRIDLLLGQLTYRVVGVVAVPRGQACGQCEGCHDCKQESEEQRDANQEDC